MDSDNPGAVSTGEEESERTLNAQDHDVLPMDPEWSTLTAPGRLTFFSPGDDLGSRVSIMVAKSPMSFWEVTFGYYTVITTKNTLLFFHLRVLSTSAHLGSDDGYGCSGMLRQDLNIYI